MRFCASACLVAALVFGGLACGGATPQQQAQKETSPSIPEMAKGFEAMAKGVKEMEAMSKEKPVDPVDFKVLEPFLPEFSGWAKSDYEGEKMTMPVAMSHVNVTYTKDEARIRLEISDAGFNRMFIAPFIMMMSGGYSKETSSGYEKSIKVGDHAGWETWQSENKDGTLHVFVAKRYLVNLDGNNIESTKVLYDLLGQIDLGKLAALK